MRYIGGKSLLLNNILDTIENNCNDVKTITDVFSGSGVVGKFFKESGYNVISNDFLYFSYVIARGTIGISEEPQFKQLEYNDVIDFLNNIKIDDTKFTIEDCFVYNNYSPNKHCDRMYFQNDNAIKIDLIRMQIEEWFVNSKITEDEYYYLLAMLLNAVPYVANITGVFGAYLKFWDNRTYNDLKLEKPALTSSSGKVECFNMDYKEILDKPSDVLYADPPYNSREYLPNYHVLETIARYDRPQIYGVTGMRNYDNQKSVFCKKNTVYGAFETLIKDCKSRYIVISYNNEGLLKTEELAELCKKYAVDNSFKLIEIDYRRYKNKIPNNKKGLKEQLYFLRRH